MNLTEITYLIYLGSSLGEPTALEIHLTDLSEEEEKELKKKFKDSRTKAYAYIDGIISMLVLTELDIGLERRLTTLFEILASVLHASSQIDRIFLTILRIEKKINYQYQVQIEIKIQEKDISVSWTSEDINNDHVLETIRKDWSRILNKTHFT